MNDGADENAGDFRLVARATYEKMLAGRGSMLAHQAELSKWLLASLIAVNGAGIAGIASLDNTEVSAPLLLAAGPWFGGGVLCALCSGLFTWWNVSIVFDVYDDLADPRMLISRERWPSVSAAKGRAITWLAGLSLLAGFLSAAAAGAGGYTVLRVVSAVSRQKEVAPSPSRGIKAATTRPVASDAQAAPG